ncbi:MAG: hypothetical protein HY649_05190 [Acidobacteria bacterium]|nr:hypothetical protein [Acidobacteriota bacterium]
MTTRAQQSQTDEDSPARKEASPGVWHLMRYAGVLQASAGQPRSSVAGVTFSLYEEQEGGAALWIETHNVQVDGQGHYAALLGGTRTEGLPAELFRSGKARWLGIQVAGQPEEVRVPLASVPYAVQAGDAETLGGRSAADYALSEQIQEVQNGLRAAGFDLAGGRFQKQARPEDPGPLPDPGTPPSNVITHETLLAKLNIVLAKLDTIDATLNEPEPVFSFVFCSEPAISYGGRFKGEFDLDGTGEGRLGAEAYGNGLFARLKAVGKITSEQELALNWDILKFGFCFDLGALVRNVTSTNSSGGATPLRQASLTATDGIAANGVFLEKIKNLDQGKMLDDMLRLADTLGVDPANLQTAMGTVASLSFDTNGGPLAALQLKDADREALMATLPIPAGVRPVVEDPGSFLRDQVESLLTQLTQPKGICNISLPPGLEPFLAEVCKPANKDPFGPLLTGMKTTTDAINTTVNSVKSTVNTVKNKVEDMWCNTFPLLPACL